MSNSLGFRRFRVLFVGHSLEFFDDLFGEHLFHDFVAFELTNIPRELVLLTPGMSHV